MTKTPPPDDMPRYTWRSRLAWWLHYPCYAALVLRDVAVKRWAEFTGRAKP